ncbi:MAG TPA: DNA polymerase III subunit beta [Prolixibacteraceae bacterium]|nr:DNA polymerase III subunit beta [Prolixibacteraceae bacterium]
MNKTAGLQDRDLAIIVSVLKQHSEVVEAWLLGIRAKGNYRTGSDVDIALKGENLTTEVSTNISYQLNEETSLPFKFDILNYNSISNIELKEHIDGVGILFFSGS